MKRTNKPITAKDFADIKELLNMGLSFSKVKKATSRGLTTIRMIDKSGSLEDYKENQRLDSLPRDVEQRREEIGLPKKVKKAKPHRNTSEDDFRKIHQLHDLEVSNKTISKIIDISVSTVDRVLAQPTWEDYQAFKADYRRRQAERKAIKSENQDINSADEIIQAFDGIPEDTSEQAIDEASNELIAALTDFNQSLLKLSGELQRLGF